VRFWNEKLPGVTRIKSELDFPTAETNEIDCHRQRCFLAARARTIVYFRGFRPTGADRSRRVFGRRRREPICFTYRVRLFVVFDRLSPDRSSNIRHGVFCAADDVSGKRGRKSGRSAAAVYATSRFPYRRPFSTPTPGCARHVFSRGSRDGPERTLIVTDVRVFFNGKHLVSRR